MIIGPGMANAVLVVSRQLPAKSLRCVMKEGNSVLGPTRKQRIVQLDVGQDIGLGLSLLLTGVPTGPSCHVILLDVIDVQIRKDTNRISEEKREGLAKQQTDVNQSPFKGGINQIRGL